MEKQPVRKWQLLLEVVIALTLAYVPLLLSGFQQYSASVSSSSPAGPGIFHIVGYAPGRFALQIALEMLKPVAVVLFLVCVVWLRREAWGKFGVVNPRYSDLFWAAVVASLTYSVLPLTEPLFTFYPLSPGAINNTFFGPRIPMELVPIVWVICAFFDEAFWRSYLFVRLRELGIASWPAILISAALFSSYHIYYGWLYLLPFFIMGTLFGYCFSRQKRLWPLLIGNVALNLSLFGNYTWTTHRLL